LFGITRYSPNPVFRYGDVRRRHSLLLLKSGGVRSLKNMPNACDDSLNTPYWGSRSYEKKRHGVTSSCDHWLQVTLPRSRMLLLQLILFCANQRLQRAQKPYAAVACKFMTCTGLVGLNATLIFNLGSATNRADAMPSDLANVHALPVSLLRMRPNAERSRLRCC